MIAPINSNGRITSANNTIESLIYFWIFGFFVDLIITKVITAKINKVYKNCNLYIPIEIENKIGKAIANAENSIKINIFLSLILNFISSSKNLYAKKVLF